MRKSHSLAGPMALYGAVLAGLMALSAPQVLATFGSGSSPQSVASHMSTVSGGVRSFVTDIKTDTHRVLNLGTTGSH